MAVQAEITSTVSLALPVAPRESLTTNRMLCVPTLRQSVAVTPDANGSESESLNHW